MFTSVIIPAAGFGERMGATISKQFLSLAGKPILVHTLERFQHCASVDEIVIASQSSSFRQIDELVEKYSLTKVRPLVEGGSRRQDSVENALQKIDARAKLVCVHDAVRPFVSKNLITQCLNAAESFGAAILAVRAKDTMKEASTDGRIARTLNRMSLWMVQTPQIFTVPILRKAYDNARRHSVTATDDSYLVEQIGVSPIIVEGNYENIKITTPDDLLFAELLAQRFVY